MATGKRGIMVRTRVARVGRLFEVAVVRGGRVACIEEVARKLKALWARRPKAAFKSVVFYRLVAVIAAFLFPVAGFVFAYQALDLVARLRVQNMGPLAEKFPLRLVRPFARLLPAVLVLPVAAK